jgi:SSS family solute:Na+ symporter
MQSSLATADYIVFLVYFVLIVGYGLWIYNRKKKESASSSDYFLAEGSLTWWAIGASLIASNISAEQFIGMSGSGFKLGLAIAIRVDGRHNPYSGSGIFYTGIS